MELFSAEFFSALAAIVVIDLVLAGDNALVIALAARGLPQHLRKQAIVWGTFGAVAVRSAMTLVVVWLLKVPGLLLAGGLLLVWIAYRLLAPVDEKGHEHAASTTTFWGAMRTIIIADAVMGLDNVLAVAGAAHGSYLLVVLGLLISIPIVIWGSTLVLKLVDRFPSVIFIGAAVLAWTAAKMITGEPMVKEFMEPRPHLAWITYLAVIGGVLYFGYLADLRRRADQAWRPVAAGTSSIPADLSGVQTLEGGAVMKRLLMPVDGSESSINAVRKVISRYCEERDLEVRLLHVRQPLTRHASKFLSGSERTAWHSAEGERALARARVLLEKWGVPFTAHVALGDRADVISAYAKAERCDAIVLGTPRRSPLLQWIRDSVAARVVEKSSVPVEVIAGEVASPLERYGIPAGIGLAAVLIAIAE